MKAENIKINNFIQIKNLNKSLLKKTRKRISTIFSEIESDLENPKKFFNILSSNYKMTFSYKKLKKYKKFKNIVIVGMGGSILGAEAIYKFLNHKIKKKIHFLNNINENQIKKLKKELNFQKTLFIIISKSGTTIETLSNLVSLDIIKKNKKNIICISEKKNNPLYEISKKYKLFFIEHKKFIGGRFSVLSEVGIVPAYLMGINVNELRSCLGNFVLSVKKNILKESVIKISNLFLQKKFSNLVFLNYIPEFEKFLFWCQQLIAESLGKKGKGFLPLISNVPKDHHSLLQLYLDGPKNNIFYIFSLDEHSGEKFNVKKYSSKIKFLENKNLTTVKKAQKNSLIQTLKKYKLDYREFKIKSVKENVLGEIFSYFILETIIIGKLSNINPYNQPAVEQVKNKTKKLLLKLPKNYF